MDSIRDIIKKNCNYKTINDNNVVKMRNNKTGIDLLHALTYRFMYTYMNTTKQSITSSLNYDNGTMFTRQAYDAKESNIPPSVYINVHNDLYTYYCDTFTKERINIVGVDGTYNINRQYDEQLNMGVFDISNLIPIKLESFGREGKNKEAQSLMNMIT